MAMYDWIKAKHHTDHSWLQLLSDDRRSKLMRMVRRAKRDDDFVDALLYTEFSDKATVIRNSHYGVHNKDMFDELDEIRKLRNYLAHANKYAETKDKARKLCEIVHLVDKWLTKLALGATIPVSSTSMHENERVLAGSMGATDEKMGQSPARHLRTP